MQPQVIKPLRGSDLKRIQTHARHIRLLKDWPGNKLDDQTLGAWVYRDAPMFSEIQRDPRLLARVSKLASQPLQPAGNRLLMFSDTGELVPDIKDPNQWILDLVLNQDGDWPYHIESVPYSVFIGSAVFYNPDKHGYYRPSIKTYDSVSRCDILQMFFLPARYCLT